jgi:hypothetical protein
MIKKKLDRKNWVKRVKFTVAAPTEQHVIHIKYVELIYIKALANKVKRLISSYLDDRISFESLAKQINDVGFKLNYHTASGINLLYSERKQSDHNFKTEEDIIHALVSVICSEMYYSAEVVDND